MIWSSLVLTPLYSLLFCFSTVSGGRKKLSYWHLWPIYPPMFKCSTHSCIIQLLAKLNNVHGYQPNAQGRGHGKGDGRDTPEFNFNLDKNNKLPFFQFTRQVRNLVWLMTKYMFSSKFFLLCVEIICFIFMLKNLNGYD